MSAVLKRRVMVGLMFDDGVLTRTKGFVADYRYTQSFLGLLQADELVLVDITRSGPSEASLAAMSRIAFTAMMPTGIGGWVRTLDDVKRRIYELGADKVLIGRGAHEDPGLIDRIAAKWGSQAVTVACDVEAGRVRGLSVAPEDWCREAEARGAGEIYLQSVGLDGSLSGFDLPMLRRVAGAVGVPVVVGTGCGGWAHMQAAFEAGADGAVTACVHHWTESAMRGFKERLAERGVAVRRVA